MESSKIKELEAKVEGLAKDLYDSALIANYEQTRLKNKVEKLYETLVKIATSQDATKMRELALEALGHRAAVLVSQQTNAGGEQQPAGNPPPQVAEETPFPSPRIISVTGADGQQFLAPPPKKRREAVEEKGEEGQEPIEEQNSEPEVKDKPSIITVATAETENQDEGAQSSDNEGTAATMTDNTSPPTPNPSAQQQDVKKTRFRKALMRTGGMIPPRVKLRSKLPLGLQKGTRLRSSRARRPPRRYAAENEDANSKKRMARSTSARPKTATVAKPGTSARSDAGREIRKASVAKPEAGRDNKVGSLEKEKAEGEGGNPKHGIQEPDPWFEYADYQCLCGLKFPKRTTIKSHIVRKNRGNIFKCHLCTYSCDAHSMLKSHVTKKHGEEYEFPAYGCGVCGLIAFDNPEELSIHRKEVHGGYNYKSNSRNHVK